MLESYAEDELITCARARGPERVPVISEVLVMSIGKGNSLYRVRVLVLDFMYRLHSVFLPKSKLK
jgi:hypothetical protein